MGSYMYSGMVFISDFCFTAAFGFKVWINSSTAIKSRKRSFCYLFFKEGSISFFSVVQLSFSFKIYQKSWNKCLIKSLR